MNYYCPMRELLKTALGKQIILEDGSKYHYVCSQVEVMNALNVVVAILEEYLITSENGVVYKLHKTKEGYWYDIEGQKETAEQVILQHLKRAFDAAFSDVKK